MTTTHFGYRTVQRDEKAELVHGVFDAVSGKYDVMNDLMSLGMHRLWKKYFIDQVDVRKGQWILDVASGTGDIALALAQKIGNGKVVATDINSAMLAKAQDRLIDHGLFSQTTCIVANAEQLPFERHTFDRLTIAFGLRNVTDQAAALRSMYHCLKPRG